MEKVTLKSWLWEMTPTGEDNIKHLNLNSKVEEVGIDYDIRGMEKPSDHAPIWTKFNL